MGLIDLLRLLRKNLAPIIILPLLFAGVAAGWAYTQPDEYTTSISMYILAQGEDTDTEVTSGDLSFSQQIANDVAILLRSPEVRKNVVAALKASGAQQSVFSVVVSSQGNSRVLSLTVNGTDPEYLAQVADTYVEETSKLAKDVMGVESVNAIAQAEVPKSPSGPQRLSYVAMAALVGLSIAIAGVILADILNTRVRSSKDVTKILDAPVVGHFPIA